MPSKILDKAAKSLKKRGFYGVLGAKLADSVEAIGRRLTYIRDHRSKYRFEDRSSGRKTLIIVLAGYKAYLWPATLERMKRHAPDDADFCIASSGVRSSALEEMCALNGWSYLSTSRNSPGIAINLSIGLHPAADYVFKLDEDIVIGKHFFRLLRSGYDRICEQSLLEPGFCAPVLNVNGISYRIFLREQGLEQDYQEQFGKLIARCEDLPVHNNPVTAYWIWQNTLPFDEKCDGFLQNEARYSVCSTRFSIGAILFRREFIDKVGGFKSAWHSGVLGVDEDILCRDCVSQSRPMYIVENVLAGHFSFYPQESLMREKLPEMALMDPVTFPIAHYAREHSNLV
jgi:hypothetical protein